MVEENGVTQVLLGITHLVLAHPIEFRHRQAESVEMARHIDEGAVLIPVRTLYANDRTPIRIRFAGVDSIGTLLFNHEKRKELALELQSMMDTGDLARSHKVLQNTVRFNHDMLAVVDLYLRAA